DPHILFREKPGTSTGNPAARTAKRPMFPPCSSVIDPQPVTTSSTRSELMSFRPTSAFKTGVRISSGGGSEKAHLRLPVAVRRSSTIKPSDSTYLSIPLQFVVYF